MLRIVCDIVITHLHPNGDKLDTKIDFVNEVEVEHSIEEPVSTARITLPHRLVVNGKEITGQDESLFHVGDYVKIGLGYDGVRGDRQWAQMRRWVFTGYVNKVLPRAPVVLECQNDFYALMQQSAKPNIFEDGFGFQMLLQLYLNDLADRSKPNFINKWEVVPKGFDFYIQKLTIKENASVYDVLNKLVEDYGIQMIYRPYDNERGTPDRLYIGQLYLGGLWKQSGTPTVYTDAHFIEDELEYQRKEDVQLRIRGKAYDPDTAKVIQVYGGDSAGDTKTVFMIGNDREELEAFVEQKADELKYTGYSGTFTCFGEPYLRVGNSVNLKDRFGMKPEGEYLIKSVRHRFGDGIGWRQEIELERKVS